MKRVPIEEAIEVAEMAEANAWEGIHRGWSAAGLEWGKACARLKELKDLRVSGQTHIEIEDDQ